MSQLRLNEPFPAGRSIVLRRQLVPPGHVWLVPKAIYGLREARSLWSAGERTKTLANVSFTSQGETCLI